MAIPVRSKPELRVAKALMAKRYMWIAEPGRMPIGTDDTGTPRTHVPDFVVTGKLLSPFQHTSEGVVTAKYSDFHGIKVIVYVTGMFTQSWRNKAVRQLEMLKANTDYKVIVVCRPSQFAAVELYCDAYVDWKGKALAERLEQAFKRIGTA